jgi:hypothetical protein
LKKSNANFIAIYDDGLSDQFMKYMHLCHRDYA